MSPIADASVRTHGRAAFIFIFVTVLLDMLALGVIVPVLPALVLQFRSGDTASGAIIYGLFATVWSVMQFVCSPVLGSLPTSSVTVAGLPRMV